MIQLLLLIALAPFTVGECPKALQELDGHPVGSDFDEALETSCGRRNYTAVFWSPLFYQLTMNELAACETKSLEDDECAKFDAFSKSLKEQFGLLKEVEAVAYVKDFFKMTRNLFKGTLLGPALLAGSIFSSFSFNFAHQLPIAAEIELSQAFKNAFQYVETAEVKKARIRTAMKAIERVGTVTRNEKLGELFAKIYELMKDDLFLVPPFDRFGEWAEKEWNSADIGHLEILPAVDTLYIQYASLNNTEAKALVEWIVASLAMNSYTNNGWDFHFPMPRNLEQLTTKINSTNADFEKICPSENIVTCLQLLPEAAKVALTTTFPELFEYFSNEADPSRWIIDTKGGQTYKILKSQIESAAEAEKNVGIRVAEKEEKMKTGLFSPNYAPSFFSFLPSHVIPIGSFPSHTMPINSFSLQ